jgi:type I restriction enzyme S subunit
MISDWRPFTELLSAIVDNRGRTCPVGEEGIPLIATNCVDRSNLYPSYDTTRFVSEETYKTWFRGHPLPGDILFVCKGSPGRTNWVPDPVDFCIAQDMVAVRADPKKVYPKYLFAALRSSVVQMQIDNMHVGTMIPHFKKGDFGKLNIPVPSPDVQRIIGDFYFTLTERIALLRETNATLEAIAQTLFKSWFVDFDPVHAKQQGIAPEGMDEATAVLFPDGFEESELGLVPRGWEIRKAETLLTRLSTKVRYTKEQVSSSGATPVYEQGAGILLGYHDSPAQFAATPNEPMFIFGDHTCVTHLSCEPFDISMNVIPLKGSDRSTLWTYYAIKDKQTFQEYRRHWMELAIKEIVVAPKEICDQFSTIASNLHVKMESNTWQANTLTTLRDTLLPRLISGQLRLPQTNGLVDAC